MLAFTLSTNCYCNWSHCWKLLMQHLHFANLLGRVFTFKLFSHYVILFISSCIWFFLRFPSRENVCITVIFQYLSPKVRLSYPVVLLTVSLSFSLFLSLSTSCSLSLFPSLFLLLSFPFSLSPFSPYRQTAGGRGSAVPYKLHLARSWKVVPPPWPSWGPDNPQTLKGKQPGAARANCAERRCAEKGW